MLDKPMKSSGDHASPILFENVIQDGLLVAKDKRIKRNQMAPFLMQLFKDNRGELASGILKKK